MLKSMVDDYIGHLLVQSKKTDKLSPTKSNGCSTFVPDLV